MSRPHCLALFTRTHTRRRASPCADLRPPVRKPRVAFAVIRMGCTAIHVQRAAVGMLRVARGMPCAAVGVGCSAFRMLCAGVGMPCAGVGMLCAGVGMPCAGVGTPCAGVGMPCAGVGMSCAAGGKGLSRRSSDLRQGRMDGGTGRKGCILLRLRCGSSGDPLLARMLRARSSRHGEQLPVRWSKRWDREGCLHSSSPPDRRDARCPIDPRSV